MRFLFVLDSVEAPAAPNPRFGRRLAAGLAAAGHDVELLELWDGRTAPPAAAGCAVHDLAFGDEAAMERILQSRAPLPARLVRLALHPAALGAAGRQFVLRVPRRVSAARRAMERLHAAAPFDAVCAVAAPYRAAFALEKAALPGARKILWQMDPYAANESYTAPGGYARERALLDAMDLVFITPQARPDFAPGGPLAACAAKTRELGFPCLEPPAAPPRCPDPCHLVFCGTLYPGLREPGELLRRFAALDDRWTLTMAGGGWDAFADARAAAQATCQDRLRLPGPLPPADAAALERDAGVLVSIGNTAANQIPSKLFGYFAAGKPVLHLAAHDRDAALPYLARWPLALALMPNDSDQALAAWLDKVAGQSLPFADAAALFPEYVPDQVVRDFAAALNAL